MDPLADAAAALGPAQRNSPAQPDEERWNAPARFTADLAVFAGHFPGNPVVPGVHHVALVVVLAERALQRQLRVCELDRVKWLIPLKPDESLVVEVILRATNDGWWADGTITTTGGVACQCRVRLRETPPLTRSAASAASVSVRQHCPHAVH